MADTQKCPECGNPLPGETATGLCVGCALKLGLQKPEAAADTARAPAPAATIRLELAPSERPGDVLGRYKLLEKIGEGGFGAVYVAEQREPVKRRVALKIIKLGMDTREVVARFEVERQALAMMDHPNIAKVLDAGALENGRPYFVMELVRGIKITDYCDQNKLPTEERLDLFVKICHAVQHAHQKGIIHRDIKPSNILVTLHDGVPVPKVIDFGIAKATQGELTDKTVYTQFQQFIGTPAYMSPEQAEMSGLDVDTRSDIYSLGVLLYELLTGRTPFEQKDLIGAGIDEMRRIIREQEPQRPSTRLSTMAEVELTNTATRRQSDVPKLVHSVRGDLDWIVMKCLEKDRTHRYETANGLAMDLKRHLDNEPVTARPPSLAYRFQKAWRRNKTAFAVASLIAAVLVAATVISVWQAVLAKRAKAEAVQRAAEAEAISKFMTEVFKSPDPSRNGRTVTVAEMLDSGVKKMDSELASQPKTKASLQATLGNTYSSLGLYSEAIALEQKVLEYDRAVLGQEAPDTLTAMQKLAESYDPAGLRNEALKLREQTLALRRKVLGPEHPDTLSAMSELARSYLDFARNDEAIKLCEQTLKLRRKVLGPEHLDTLASMHNLANSYEVFGRREEALKLREQVLELSRKIKGPEHPDTLTAMNNLGVSYFEAGRPEDALKLREEALELSRKVCGPEHPGTLMAMENLAISYFEAGRREEARKLIEQTLELSLKALGPEHPSTLVLMSDVGVLYIKEGRLKDGLKMLEQASAGSQKVFGPEHPDTLNVKGNLAVTYYALNRKDEALKMREEVAADRRREHPLNELSLSSALDNLADSYRDADRIDEAIKLLEELAPLRTKVLGSKNGDTLNTMIELADCYHQTGRHDEADDLLEKASKTDPKNAGPMLELASWEAWLGHDADYEATCRRCLQAANGTNTAGNADAAAKACFLRPSTNANLLAEALTVARRAAELANDPGAKTWTQFDLGLAQFRNGQFADAKKSLDTAERTAESVDYDSCSTIQGISDLLHAIISFREGKREEAQKLFLQAKTEMPPLPADETKPRVVGKTLNHDMLLWWMIYKEANSLLNEPAVVK